MRFLCFAVVFSLLVASAYCAFGSPRIRERKLVARDEPTFTSSTVGPFFCFEATCVNPGGNCSALGSECIGNSKAIIEYDPITFEERCTCKPLLAVGANCTDPSAGGCEYECYDNVCRNEAFQSAEPGDVCTSEDDCSFPTEDGQPLCSNGRCRGGILLGGYCGGVGIGTRGCVNSYCDSDTLRCQPFRGLGTACNSSDVCYLFTECLNGVCAIPDIVSSVGGNCTINPCGDNLYCGTDEICHSVSDITRAACNTSNTCTRGLSCECNQKTGTGQCSAIYLASIGTYLNAYKAIDNCWFAHNCQNNTYTDQCTPCKALACQFAAEVLAVDIFYLDPNNVPTCIYDDVQSQKAAAVKELNCPVTPNAASAPIGSNLLLATALMMFIMVSTFF